MRLRHTAPLIGLVCLVLTGCTTTSQGEPTPETTTSTSTDSPPSSTDGPPANGAPEVDDPLDTTRFQEDPCATLTSKQAADLNLPTAGEPASIAKGVGCQWDNRDTRGSVLIGFFTEIDSGLSSIYATNDAGDFAYFEPLPDIDGYPAVAADVDDRRARGTCTVFVGVTDQLVTQITVRLSSANVGQKVACEVTVDVAGMALRTMREGR